jgi:hypothetical protein
VHHGQLHVQPRSPDDTLSGVSGPHEEVVVEPARTKERRRHARSGQRLLAGPVAGSQDVAVAERQRTPDIVGHGQIALNHFHAFRRVILRRIANKSDGLVASAGEGTSDAAADSPGRPGNENLHQIRFPSAAQSLAA